MWTLVAVLSTAAVLGAVMTGGAAAQEVPTSTPNATEAVNATTSSTSSSPTTAAATSTSGSTAPNGTVIQPGLVLVESSVGPDGTATVTLRAEDPTAVTLTDAGAVFQGGTVPQKTRVVEPGTTSISLPTTETESGARGITIATSRKLYGVVLEEPGFLLETPVAAEWVALVSGVALTLGSAVIIKRRRDRVRDEGVVRVDG